MKWLAWPPILERLSGCSVPWDPLAQFMVHQEGFADSALGGGELTLYFESADCTVQALLGTGTGQQVVPIMADTLVWRGVAYLTTEPFSIRTISSRSSTPYVQPACENLGGIFVAPESCCFSQPAFAEFFAPVSALVLNSLGLSPPFHLEAQPVIP